MCGAVSVVADPAKNRLTVCHCDMCRRWCSGPFMSLAAKPGSVSTHGPVRRLATSDWAERAICSDCGSPLWYRITEPGPGFDEYHLAAGLFDLQGMVLSQEVFIDKKPAAYSFAGHTRQFTEAECLAHFAPGEGDA